MSIPNLSDTDLKLQILGRRSSIRTISRHIRALERELTCVRGWFDEEYRSLHPLELELARREERYKILAPHSRKPPPQPKPLAAQIAEQMQRMGTEDKQSLFEALCRGMGFDPSDIVVRAPQMEDTDD